PARARASYEWVGRVQEESRPVVASSGADQEQVEQLRNHGYIAGGAENQPSDGAAEGQGQALVTAHLNEAGLFLKKKDYAQAQAAVDAALKVQPGYTQALLVQVEVAEARQDHDRAIEVARSILEKDRAEHNGLYIQLGHAYRHGGRG